MTDLQRFLRFFNRDLTPSQLAAMSARHEALVAQHQLRRAELRDRLMRVLSEPSNFALGMICGALICTGVAALVYMVRL